jgi:hypothetical protein
MGISGRRIADVDGSRHPHSVTKLEVLSDLATIDEAQLVQNAK